MTRAATMHLHRPSKARSQPQADTQTVKRTLPRAAHPPNSQDRQRVPKKAQRADDYARLILQIEALEARRVQMKEQITRDHPNGVVHGTEFDLTITDGVAVWKDNVFKAKIDELILNNTTAKYRAAHSGTTPYKKIGVKARTTQ